MLDNSNVSRGDGPTSVVRLLISGRPDSNRRRPAWEDLPTLAICFSAPHQSASYEASMMQRDGRGEAVLMPLGDRFGDPISESAALRATFSERPKSLASGSRAPRDCGARATTVAPANVERRRASSGNDAAGQVLTAGGSMRSDCAEVGSGVPLPVFSSLPASHRPAGTSSRAGRPRD